MTQKHPSTIDEGSEIVTVEASAVEIGTLRGSTPSEVVSSAASVAKPLADLINSQGLSVGISGRRYVKAEGWTTLAALLGIVPREVSNERLEDGGYLATVELVRLSDGQVISRATAECGMDEPTWATRKAYARRSMAATRATGKACRLAFSWVMALAGYEPTPFEEMPPPGEMNGAAPAPMPPSPPPLPVEPSGPVISFGKNKGKRVSELTDRQLQWYAESWEVLDVNKDGTPREARWVEKDAALKDACVEAWNERQNAPAGDDEIPF